MTSFVLIMFGFPTGDLNPICNAPMLGAHHAMHRMSAPPRLSRGCGFIGRAPSGVAPLSALIGDLGRSAKK
jgi:hypothetical protein